MILKTESIAVDFRIQLTGKISVQACKVYCCKDTKFSFYYCNVAVTQPIEDRILDNGGILNSSIETSTINGLQPYMFTKLPKNTLRLYLFGYNNIAFVVDLDQPDLFLKQFDSYYRWVMHGK